MTENEAKEFIEKAKEQSKNVLAELLLLTPKVFAVKKENLGEYYSNLENCKKEIEACNVAVKALEENQRWHISEVNPNIKNVFANLSTQICHNCDHKDEYIEELEAEIEQYRAIGTPEECRAAVEQKAKKVIEKYKAEAPEDIEAYGEDAVFGYCPVCGGLQSNVWNTKYCGDCGQKLDWSDEE